MHDLRMTRIWHSLIAIVAAIVVTCISWADSRSESSFSIPLDNGRLNLRDVVRKASDELGIAPPNAIDRVSWSINVQSLLGRVQLKLFDRLAAGVIESRVEPNEIVVTIDRERLKAKLHETGRSLDDWVAELSGRMVERQNRAYGILFTTPHSDGALLAELDVVPSRVVILVHGLDDPGFMWRDLIPQLQAEGYHVARFEYPNDAAISESADLFASSLEEMKRAGVERVDVIAHSMGGLVMRDVLTRPAYYAGDGSGQNAPGYPAVDRLIMLGTPNHGSKWARLRTIAELREHFYRAWHGETGWFSGFDADGSGEAGVDLLPNSDFLRRLNDRPPPTHTKYTIIAGEAGTEFAGNLKSLAERAQKFASTDRAPSWLRELVAPEEQDKAISLIGDVVNELGDGCVSIESTKLRGIDDFHIVAGNHLSMIVNVGSDKNTDRVPPAIPMILERLSQGE